MSQNPINPKGDKEAQEKAPPKKEEDDEKEPDEDSDPTKANENEKIRKIPAKKVKSAGTRKKPTGSPHDGDSDAEEETQGSEKEKKVKPPPKSNRPPGSSGSKSRPVQRKVRKNPRPTPPPPPDDSYCLPMNTLTICLIVGVVGLLLMIITGGIVYAVYDYKGKGFGLIGASAITTPEPPPMYPPPELLSFRPPGYVPVYAPDPSEPCPATPTCPKCNVVQGCQQAPPQQGCIVVFRPPRCPTPGPCPSGSCRQCPTYPPLKTTFDDAEKTSRTVLEWLNMYPPYSANRLHILTHLLDQTVEKWALGGFMHRCTSHSNFDRDTTKCTMCNDRYHYIKCVMSNTLTDSLYPPAADNNMNKPYYHPSDDDFHGSRYEVSKTVYMLDGLKPDQLGYIFTHMEKTIRPFQVRTRNGKECRICTDYNRQMYNKCFLEGNAY